MAEAARVYAEALQSGHEHPSNVLKLASTEKQLKLKL